jgi:hypothetical protein
MDATTKVLKDSIATAQAEVTVDGLLLTLLIETHPDPSRLLTLWNEAATDLRDVGALAPEPYRSTLLNRLKLIQAHLESRASG